MDHFKCSHCYSVHPARHWDLATKEGLRAEHGVTEEEMDELMNLVSIVDNKEGKAFFYCPSCNEVDYDTEFVPTEKEDLNNKEATVLLALLEESW